ncbi:MAG: carboxypeptidase-like regulatory domain-containing protein, partial [Bacteroidales bacterium]|nr:carboxypeptidase-like regulatory domain-containing protein [Bacteroidales bacterium]
MKKLKIVKLIYILIMIYQLPITGQEISQTIRGSVVDQETYVPLLAATVAVYSDSILFGAGISDSNGYFRIEKIPVGRYTVIVSYMGYLPTIVPDIIVNSSKEIVLQVEMEESPLEIEEISVSATEGKGKAMNKLAYVSARSFSVEESERYAGSRGDPARMASNFAGVQGNDDSNNDLVIRGNSPLGVLWRLEGVNIPNPNHFGVCGTTGGPVSILNNKVLSLSDFMTGAFPAEYGNSIAGVFDLRMRNGNNESHEFSGQLGFLGTEIMAEGPISQKGKSSYLAAYRYSTMAIFQMLGINIGTDAVPKYQDLSFKLNFPTRKHGNISMFGIGGKSAIDILASEQLDPDDDAIFGDEAMNEHFRTGMGV